MTTLVTRLPYQWYCAGLTLTMGAHLNQDDQGLIVASSALYH